MAARAILHVDMDAFYAAIEQRDNPELRGKPVVVGALPGRRGVVSTCSYEARTFGVRSAMPISQAVERLPHGIYLPPRMEVYAAVSRQVMAILERYTPLVEPLSLDEAFLDVTGTERLFGTPVEIAERIRREIRDELALTASVGVAPNKFLAKLASDLRKPDALVVIRAEEAEAVLAPLPARKIFGIGPESERALARAGIHTIGDLQRCPEEHLVRRFGSLGHTLKELAHGRDDRPVEPDRAWKSHGAETTFPRDVTDVAALRNCLLRFAVDIAFDLRRHRLVCRTVGLKLRYHDFTTLMREHTVDDVIRSGQRLYEEGVALLLKENPTRPVRLIGLYASHLRHEDEGVQKLLFGGEDKAVRVERAIDIVRERFGKDTIKRGSLLAPEDPPDTPG
ncbi:MAG: DNA polymerase IV [Planctomycetota bacterium]